jgi:hypothetical protein
MWKPGTLLHIRGERLEEVMKGGIKLWNADRKKQAQIGLVVAVIETGWGSSVGAKWNALLFTCDKLINLKDVQRYEDWFIIHRIPS